MITGPTGAISVPSSLNLHLSGSSEATVNISDSVGNTAHLGSAQMDVGVIASIPGLQVTGGFSQLSGANGAGPTCPGACPITSATGVLAGASAPTGFTTGMTVLPVGTPFTVFLELATDAIVSYGGQNTGVQGEQSTVNIRAVSDFSSTFSFPTSGPVFNLPAGFTVNSVSADIVNNQFVGGGTAPTPEPSTLLLVFGGTALLLPLIRHRLP